MLKVQFKLKGVSIFTSQAFIEHKSSLLCIVRVGIGKLFPNASAFCNLKMKSLLMLYFTKG